MNNQELTQVLTKEISKRVQEHLSKVFKDISESYDEIDYDTLMKKYSVNIILDSNKKKTNEYFFISKLLSDYNLPNKIVLRKNSNIKQKIHDEIYKGVFLDKKKIKKDKW